MKNFQSKNSFRQELSFVDFFKIKPQCIDCACDGKSFHENLGWQQQKKKHQLSSIERLLLELIRHCEIAIVLNVFPGGQSFNASQNSSCEIFAVEQTRRNLQEQGSLGTEGKWKREQFVELG